MLKLSMATHPRWIELGMGVRVKVRPCNSAVFYQARAFMQTRLQQLGEDYRHKKEAGADLSALPSLEEGTVREAVSEQYLTIGLAIAGIMEWEGVLNNDESDTPAPVTSDNITQLFSEYWVIAVTFHQDYIRLYDVLAAEKNGSRSSLSGTSVMDQTTVTTVPNRKNRAAKDKSEKTANAAPMSKTGLLQ